MRVLKHLERRGAIAQRYDIVPSCIRRVRKLFDAYGWCFGAEFVVAFNPLSLYCPASRFGRTHMWAGDAVPSAWLSPSRCKYTHGYFLPAPIASRVFRPIYPSRLFGQYKRIYTRYRSRHISRSFKGGEPNIRGFQRTNVIASEPSSGGTRTLQLASAYTADALLCGQKYLSSVRDYIYSRIMIYCLFDIYSDLWITRNAPSERTRVMHVLLHVHVRHTHSLPQDTL